MKGSVEAEGPASCSEAHPQALRSKNEVLRSASGPSTRKCKGRFLRLARSCSRNAQEPKWDSGHLAESAATVQVSDEV